MIISFLSEKGGVGKTTLATNIARCLQLYHHKSVLLVDSDPQGSSRDWHELNEGKYLDVVGLDRPTLDVDIIKFKNKYDFIIIDGAGKLCAMTTKAILCSNIILLPVQPCIYDVLASKNLVDLIHQRQEITGGKLKAAFIVNRQITGTNLGKEIRPSVSEYNLPVFENGTFQRIIYAESASTGNTVCETNNHTAKDEIYKITHELMEFINA